MSRRQISEAERQLIAHVTRFGSDGYPVRKLGRGWVWGTEGVEGPPTVFRTKREAVASFESFWEVLREALSAEKRDEYILETLAGYGGDEERTAEWIAGAIKCSIRIARSMVREAVESRAVPS